jgi:hypothetical protein
MAVDGRGVVQRIPNPVSDLDVFLRVFKDIHGQLAGKGSFGLDDISQAMVDTRNVTSQGAIGAEALRRSTRVDRSRDPIYNQSKMYAELFRTLGWIQSTSSKLTYTFSLLGEHVATATNPAALLRECLLGIAYPNEVLGVQSDQTVRVIGGILLALDALGTLSRDEMMAGPMSIKDDTDTRAFTAMLTRLSDCRKKAGALDKWIDDIAEARGISRSPTMENYTRFPMAAFPWSGWATKGGRGVLHITEQGKAAAAALRAAQDVRLSGFMAIPQAGKPAFIRLSFYEMLKRSGFKMEPVEYSMRADEKALKAVGGPVGPLYFSPFQQLSRSTIRAWVPDFAADTEETATHHNSSPLAAERSRPRSAKDTALILELSDDTAVVAQDAQALVRDIKQALKRTPDVQAATDALVAAYATSNKQIFYPLVANLFCVVGLDCRVSRVGQNYERADAIIVDPAQSIPIEIKSPGEEEEISVKGIRQALENKVVLLSRAGYATRPETTSLVVGFNPPHDRSEVHELIDDISATFAVNIGVVPFRPLVQLAVEAVRSNKKPRLGALFTLRGVMSVSTAPTAN